MLRKPNETIKKFKRVNWPEGEGLAAVREFDSTHVAFEQDAILSLKKKAVRNIAVSSNDDEKKLCGPLSSSSLAYKSFNTTIASLLNAKAGDGIRIGLQSCTLPKNWEPKPGRLGFGKTEGSALYKMLVSFQYKDDINEQVSSVINVIDQAEELLRGEKDNQTKFSELRALLSKHADKLAEEPFTEIDIWLRYHLVRIFQEIHNYEMNFHLFKQEVEKIEDDAEGVQKTLCDDYIYRRAFSLLENALDSKEISSTFFKESDDAARLKKPDKTGFNSSLMTNVTIPLIKDRMPYFTQRFGETCYMTDATRKYGEQDESFLKCFNERRDDLNDVVRSALKNRIMEFGKAKKLEDLSFDEFYESRYPTKKKTVYKAAAQPVVAEVKTTKQDEESKAESPSSSFSDSSAPQGKNITDSMGTASVAKAPLQSSLKNSNASPVKLEPQEGDEVTPPKKSRVNLRKVAVIVVGAIIGAAIGYFVGIPMLVGVAAIAVPVAIGFAVGALVGWAATKCMQCSRDHVKKADPVIADERSAAEPVPSPKRNPGLDQFHQARQAAKQPEVSQPEPSSMSLVFASWLAVGLGGPVYGFPLSSPQTEPSLRRR